MATPIVVSCPQCQKQIKAPPELQGKKIRCKGCGTTFPVLAESAAEPAPAKARPPVKQDEEEGDGNPYGMSEVQQSNRCPFCAAEMENPEAVVCLSCGYNTRTRQRIETKKVIETTAGDRMSWLMPGIICVGVVIVLIVLDILYLVWEPNPKSDVSWLAYRGFKTWGIIASLFIMFFAGRFAIKRLIFNAIPPEKAK
jgi:hypothetical protein